MYPLYSSISGWWFGTFFIFTYIGNNHPNWLIFFRGVETTNQIFYVAGFCIILCFWTIPHPVRSEEPYMACSEWSFLCTAGESMHHNIASFTNVLYTWIIMDLHPASSLASSMMGCWGWPNAIVGKASEWLNGIRVVELVDSTNSYKFHVTFPN